MDGLPDIEARLKSALVYPFPARPAVGEMLPVAAGVHWIRMPLPFALDHINLWLLDDGPGRAVVDTGVHSAPTSAAWRQLLESAPGQAPVTRVFVTHMHPDHVGMAGWLTREFSVRLWMSAPEYFTCRAMVSDTGREAPPDAIAFYRRAGWADASIQAYRARFGGFGKLIHPLPDSFRRLEDGEEIRIGAHAWRVVLGTGHSPGHACLYCPELAVLISGDQVLPRISSNVSVYPTEPDADPMAGWLASLEKLRRAVPDDVLVLPAHNEPFRGLHARLEALRVGQERALDRLRAALDEPRRAIDVFGALFKRAIGEQDVQLLGLATGESLACLNYLVRRGEAVCDVADDGVARWRRVPVPH